MRMVRPALAIAITALFLAACGAAASLGGSSATALSSNYADALPSAGQLAAGTLGLEGTTWAVDAEQASQLLPLWQGLLSLLNSPTSSDQEINGVVTQIEAAMTPDQVAAISAMHLTASDLAALIVSGPEADEAGSRPGVSGQASGFASGGPGPDGAVFIGGGPGADGLAGLPGSSSSLSEATQTSNQTLAAQTASGQLAAIGVNARVVQAVINFLLSRAG